MAKKVMRESLEPSSHEHHDCSCKVKCKNCRCQQQKNAQDILVSLET